MDPTNTVRHKNNEKTNPSTPQSIRKQQYKEKRAKQYILEIVLLFGRATVTEAMLRFIHLSLRCSAEAVL